MNMPKDLVRNEERKWNEMDTSPSQYFQKLLRRHDGEGGKQTQKRWHNY